MGLSGDRAQVGRDCPWGEQRLEDAPVAPPSLAFADEQAVAEQPRKLGEDGSVLEVVPGVGGQYLARAGRVEHRVEDEPHPWRADAEADEVAVGSHRPLLGAELVALKLAAQPSSGDPPTVVGTSLWVPAPGSSRTRLPPLQHRSQQPIGAFQRREMAAVMQRGHAGRWQLRQ
ncbi:MAG: hypothetical protein M3276_03605 [Actinomycetota bacterium]|nr:hypothetical protein [Actinomycetota bacterium]